MEAREAIRAEVLRHLELLASPGLAPDDAAATSVSKAAFVAAAPSCRRWHYRFVSFRIDRAA